MAIGISLDNHIHFQLRALGGRSREELLLGRLEALRTGVPVAVAVWQMPDGVMFEKAFASKAREFYVQAAGRDDRLTVEWRRAEPGGPRQYVVGRLGAEAGVDGPPTETVVWDVYSTQVYPNEVFTPEEALVVFTEYMATGSLGPNWSLRLLPLG